MQIKLNNLLKMKSLNESERSRRRKVRDEEQGNTPPADEDVIRSVPDENVEVKKRRRKVYNSKAQNKVLDNIKTLIFNKNNYSRGTYYLLFGMICLATASVSLTIKSYKALNEEDYETFLSDDNVQAVSSSSVETLEESDNDESGSVETSSGPIEVSLEESNEQEEVAAPELLDFKSPLTGEVIKIYSIDKVIYSKTLDMWKVHDGIDIEGKMGEAVYASEKGTVEKIFNDSFLGMTVVISHNYNYKTSYSNLAEDVPVKVGQEVKKGQRIGNISDTAIGEIKDSPHIHFMVFKDDKTIDPASVLD